MREVGGEVIQSDRQIDRHRHIHTHTHTRTHTDRQTDRHTHTPNKKKHTTLGFLQLQVPYGAHGYGSFFTFATLDHHYKDNMTLDEAKDVLKKCFLEVRAWLLGARAVATYLRARAKPFFFFPLLSFSFL